MMADQCSIFCNVRFCTNKEEIKDFKENKYIFYKGILTARYM